MENLLTQLNAFQVSGKIFTVTFIKRSNGQLRKMKCRFGVTKYLRGGRKSYSDSDKNLVTVFDLEKGEYRSIPVDGIIEINGIKVDSII